MVTALTCPQTGRTSVQRAHGQWAETGLVVLVGSLLVLVTAWPAFDAYFLGENFLYLGQFRAHGSDFLRALFSANDNVWFRPVFFSMSLPWFFVLPPDPWYYHVRNFAFTAINIALLHRILIYLVSSKIARFSAVIFFSISKVHLTTIGYINIYDSIVMLLFLLSTVLYFLRYLEYRQTVDYVFGLVFTFLATFSKEFGPVVAGVVLALIVSRDVPIGSWRSWLYRWVPRLAPLPAMGLLYLGLRSALVESLSSNPNYAPQISFQVIGRNLVALSAGTANLSFTEPGRTGAGGLGAWFASAAPAWDSWLIWTDGLMYVVWTAIVFVTVLAARGRGWVLLFPVAWIAAYFAPTLLTRNLQMYYLYEPLAGVSVLVAMCLDRGRRWLLSIWAVALLIVGANGLISNYTSVYHWQFTASSVRKIERPVLEAYQGRLIDSLTIVTSSEAFWRYALTSDSKGPMLPELMRLPNLKVSVIPYSESGRLDQRVEGRDLVLDADNGFQPYDVSRPLTPPVLVAVSPARASVGAQFNVQTGGQSALAFVTEHATPGTVAIMSGRELVTAYGSSSFLSALIPAELLAEPGRLELYLRNGRGESNRIEFIVDSEGPMEAGGEHH